MKDDRAPNFNASSDEIAAIIARYRASGLGLKAFALEEGLPPGRLHYWIYQKPARVSGRRPSGPSPNGSTPCAQPGRIAGVLGRPCTSGTCGGHNADLTLLRPQLEAVLARYEFGLIILDPAYKLLGNRDENANGDIASLMNEFEGLCRSTGAAVIVAHHFAKGDSTAKNAMDRMSGAGAWARDPDSIMVLTPHEEPDCFTVTSILRNLPQVAEFVVAWEYPLMTLANDLNPDALRRPQAKNKVCTDKEFVEKAVGSEARSYTKIVAAGEAELGLSRRSVARYLERLTTAGLVVQGGGLYWAKRAENDDDANP
jgi:hypothetical protein